MKILHLDIDYYEIPGHEKYFVSRSGVVLSVKSGKPKPLSVFYFKGYKRVKAGKNSLMIHRAVALVFVPNPDSKPDVNHMDGNKQNNDPENLEWVTRGENVLHSLRTGLHVNKETPIMGVNKNTGEGLWLLSQALSARYGFQQPNVNKCLAGLRPQHKGWEWSYA